MSTQQDAQVDLNKMETVDEVVAPTELVIYAPVEEETSHLSSTNSSNISEMPEIVHLSTIMDIPDESKNIACEIQLYLCDKCNRTFKQKSRYERHITNHPSEKHYLCSICQKTFTRMSHLEKHTRTHTEERRHVCNICGAAFILPHHLVRHMLIHTGVRPFECEICQKQFTRKAGLTQHQYVHTGMRPYICSVQNCSKQFTDRTTLRRHVLTHSREKPFICKECDKTFRTKSACRKHYLRHFKGGQSYKCGICEEMFKSEESLREHNTIHEHKQKIGVFRCGFCLRVFKSQNDLDSHVPLHESGLIHSCSQCCAKFYTDTDLLSHVEKHIENEFTFNLPDKICDKIRDIDHQLEDIQKHHDTTTVHVNTPTAINENKVVVVLQLPSTSTGLKSNQLRLENIQQLLGNAQIDKLLVTTDNVSDSSATLSVQLSEDQQNGIQQILQTANISDADYMKLTEHPSSNDLDSNLNSDIDSLSPAHTGTNSLLQTPYVLSQDKQNSSYIIVPQSYKEPQPTISSPNQSFSSTTAIVGFNLASESNTSSPRKLGESVFKSNKNNVDRPAVLADTNLAAQNRVGSLPKVENHIEHHSNKDYQLYENTHMESKTPTLFAGDFGNALCDNNMLDDDEDDSHFTIVTSV